MDDFSRTVTLDAREITEAQFVDKYAHPFLSIDVSAEADAGKFKTNIAKANFVEVAPPPRDDTGQVPEEMIAPVTKRLGANSYSFITIGRAHNNDVVVPSSSISKCHAVIYCEHDRYKIADAGSRNGTAFNGETLPANEPVALESGDVITLGGSVRVKFRDARALYSFLHR